MDAVQREGRGWAGGSGWAGVSVGAGDGPRLREGERQTERALLWGFQGAGGGGQERLDGDRSRQIATERQGQEESERVPDMES